MASIKVLPEDVARRIAAGEVVERPASVVKELVENALDAGANVITVRTAGAGSKLIEVTDNGCGMSADDIALAPRSFSTSKIARSEDLFKVETYGFRGEALASISAVSRFEIVSSDRTDGEGWRLEIEGKTVTDTAPAAHERGTTVRVRDLFFNTPARKKFLKSELTERRRILETILAFALIDPRLEIHYLDGDKPVLDLLGGDSWRERVAAILGSGTMKHMAELHGPEGPIRVAGFASLPTHTRGNRNQQFLYVNRRLVKEKTIAQAVHEAYRSVIPYKRFPVAVVSLEVPLDAVDVNVHPSKLEVRINDPRRVFDVVRSTIRRALSAQSESALEVSYSSRPGSRPAPFAAGADAADGQEPIPSGAGTGVDAYRDRVKDAYASYMNRGAPELTRPDSAPDPRLAGGAVVSDFNPQLSLRTGTTDRLAHEPVDDLKEKIQSEETLFWQFNNSYVFIQVRGGIVVLDQHAAHERIIFDTSKERLKREIPVSQQILFPIHLELSLSELDVFRTSRETFRKLGFHLEPFGGKSILVRGYPQGLKNWEEGKLLRQIFDDILHDRVEGESHADRVIASFACRSAVRAGQRLSMEEMKMLADQLFAVPNPYSCPHGRPTIQRISLEEIESWFLRR